MSQHEEYTSPPGFRVSGAGGTKLAPVLIDPAAPAIEGDVITRVGTGYTPQAPSGGGPILVADAQLTDAQFKALPSGPFTLLAAPAAGFMYLVRDWIAVLDTRGGVGYGNIGGYVYFTVNADLKRVRYLDSIQWPDLLTNVLPRSGVELSVLGPIPSTDTSFLTAGGVGVVGGPVTFQLDNVDNVDDYNSVGPFTGGHVDNSFSVRVWYSLVPTVPFGA
jgi:hypothetical protein